MGFALSHRLRPVLGASLLGVTALLPGCAEEAPPRFAEDACEVLPVADARSGERISGIEDAARLDDGTVLLSAYDRRATEAALSRGEPAPEGNLYRLDPASLADAAPVLAPLLPPGALGAEGFRPHGIAARGEEVLLVNRGVKDGALAPRLARFEWTEKGLAPLPVIEGRRPLPWCAANDVAFLEDGVAVTFDRAGCGGFRPLETLGAARGALLAAGEVTNGLSFANGVLPLEGGGIAVAETRAKRIGVVGGPDDGRRYPLGGAPDNLTRAPDGRILAAVQPNLFRFALYRYGFAKSAPSALVLLDPASGAVERLYEGGLLPGLTFGMLTEVGLIAGSVRGEGLLLCREAA